jgi:hypothetical protein
MRKQAMLKKSLNEDYENISKTFFLSYVCALQNKI